MCLYYDCQGKDDNIPYPVVVPADFARNLERERDKYASELQTLCDMIMGGKNVPAPFREVVAMLASEGLPSVQGSLPVS